MVAKLSTTGQHLEPVLHHLERAPTCYDRMNFLCETLCAARDKTFEVTSNRLMMSAEVTSGEIKKSGFTSTILRHLR